MYVHQTPRVLENITNIVNENKKKMVRDGSLAELLIELEEIWFSAAQSLHAGPLVPADGVFFTFLF